MWKGRRDISEESEVMYCLSTFPLVQDVAHRIMAFYLEHDEKSQNPLKTKFTSKVQLTIPQLHFTLSS